MANVSAFHTRVRGFGLIQALIAIVVIGGVIVSFSAFMSHYDKQKTREMYVNIEARELSMLHQGLSCYFKSAAAGASDPVDAWTVNSAHMTSQTTDDLVAQNCLPEDFAKRGTGAAGSTFFGQPYRFWASRAEVKDASGLNPGDSGYTQTLAVVGVVYEGGLAAPGILARTGIDTSNASAIASLKRAIVAKATGTYHVPAASIAANSKIATGALSGWSKDIGALWSGFAGVNQARAAVLVGFPDLEGVPTPPDDTNGGSKSKWNNVQLLASRTYSVEQDPSSGHWVAKTPTPSCKAVFGSQYQELTHWPECNHGYGTSQVYATDVGTISFRRHVVTTYDTYQVGWIIKPCNLPGSADPTGTACRSLDGWSAKGVKDMKTLPTTNVYKNIYLNGALIGGDRSLAAWDGPNDRQCGLVEPVRGHLYRNDSTQRIHCYQSGETIANGFKLFGKCVDGNWSYDSPAQANTAVGISDTTATDRLCGIPVSP